MLARKFKNLIRAWLKSRQFEEIKLNDGRVLGLFKGTLGRKPDKDDAWYFALARQYRFIYDLGANIGQTALLALLPDNNIRERKVVLVDPNPEALAMAAYNLIRNGFADKCVFVNRFVSDQDNQRIKFYTIGPGAAGSMYSEHAQTASALGSYMMVSSITLHQLFQSTSVIPELVKIDVEGAEQLVLAGLAEVLDITRPDIFLELHSNSKVSMEENAGFVLAWCRANNYVAWYLKTKEKLTTADMVAHRGRCHLLLLPKNKAFPEVLKNIEQGDAVNI